MSPELPVFIVILALVFTGGFSFGAAFLVFVVRRQKPYGYLYDGHVFCDDDDFADFFDGAPYDKAAMKPLYSSGVI